MAQPSPLDPLVRAWPLTQPVDRSDGPVSRVSAGGGMLIAGGGQLVLLRPGSVHAWNTGLPPTEPPIAAVAAETRPPYRYAFAFEGALVVMVGDPPTLVAEFMFKDPGMQPTHLAWACIHGVSALYARTRDGVVARLRDNEPTLENSNLPLSSAIASDAAGNLAMLMQTGEDLFAIVARDGLEMNGRAMSAAPVGAPDIHVAVAGDAVAYSAGTAQGVYLGRTPDSAMVRCDGLMGGPVAFQGSATDAPLFAARNYENGVAIDRVTHDGTLTRILALAAAVGPEAPSIEAMSWDATRRTLWCASPRHGLIGCVEPSADGKKIVLS